MEIHEIIQPIKSMRPIAAKRPDAAPGAGWLMGLEDVSIVTWEGFVSGGLKHVISMVFFMFSLHLIWDLPVVILFDTNR